jgi:serine/threonine protein kinase
LKPENIFCVQGGPAKVLDLGTAKFSGNNAPTTQTARGKVTGTAAYIAPERLAGEPGNERSDIYSLGLVLYECIAGFHPLVPTGNWPNAAEIAARQINCHPQSIPGLSPIVWAIIAKATQKKPERRYGSMREMRSALREVSAGPKGAQDPTNVAPIKSNWASLGLPIVAGIIVGSSVSGVVFHFRPMHSVESVASPLPSATVTLSQAGEVKPLIPLRPALVLSAGAEPVLPSSRVDVAPESMAASRPARDSLPVEKSLMSTGISPITGRTLAGSATKRSALGPVDSRSEKPPSAGGKATVAPVNSSKLPAPRTSNEVLPASGL